MAESRFRNIRKLRSEEKALLECLLREAEAGSFEPVDADALMAQELNDGGMASIRLLVPGEPERRRTKVRRIADRQFKDIDGIPVLVSLTVDQDRRIIDLDIWKVDFSPVRKFPTCESRQSEGGPVRDIRQESSE